MIAINFFQFFAICLKARNFSNIKHIGGGLYKIYND
jgi:hypothetical protein